MRTPVAVKQYPIANHASGVLLGFEATPMRALLLQGPDDPLHHPILLRTMRRDELLPQSVAAHQARVVAAGKDQAVVGAK